VRTRSLFFSLGLFFLELRSRIPFSFRTSGSLTTACCMGLIFSLPLKSNFLLRLLAFFDFLRRFMRLVRGPCLLPLFLPLRRAFLGCLHKSGKSLHLFFPLIFPHLHTPQEPPPLSLAFELPTPPPPPFPIKQDTARTQVKFPSQASPNPISYLSEFPFSSGLRLLPKRLLPTFPTPFCPPQPP